MNTDPFDRGEAGAPGAQAVSPGAAPYAIPPPGHRLSAGTRLGPVRLQVADLRRSLAYYEDVLGFRAVDRSAGRAALGAYGDDTVLVELRERSGARPVPHHGRLGLYHFAILLPDRPALGSFAAHLASTGTYAGASDHGVSEAFYLHDPDGLGIEVYADRPRGTWISPSGTLVMFTREIDMRSLLQAAGPAWSGMPAGTTVGHVHLHVGDLVEARAFFHDALGFDEIFRMPSALFLSAGGYHHHLGTNTWAGRAPRPGEEDARLLEWTIVVPRPEDAAAAARSLETAGFGVTRAEDDWLAADPWGTSFRLTPSGDGA